MVSHYIFLGLVIYIHLVMCKDKMKAVLSSGNLESLSE